MSIEKSIILKPAKFNKWVNNNNLSTCVIDFECSDPNYLSLKVAGWSLYNGVSACYVDILDNPQQGKLICILRTICKDKIKTLIAHNFPFDGRILYQLNIPHTNNIYCSMTNQHLLDENNPKGLKWLSKNILGKDRETTKFTDAISDGFHSSRFYKYAISDSIDTWDLYQWQVPRLKQQKLWDLWYNIERPFQFCLRDLSINGILVNRDELIKLQEQLREEVIKLQLSMYDAGNIEYYFQEQLFDNEAELIPAINLNSPIQLSNFIRKDLNIKLTETTNSGQFSTKNRVLESIKNQHEFIRLLLSYRSASKMLNSFLIPLPELIQSDGRIRVNFMNTVAVTGRVSASRLHQLPKDNTGPVPIRQCFIPPKGKVLLCADYAGQELRVLAHVSKDPTMIQAFKDKIDVHLLVANIFFELGIPVEALIETHPDYKSYRKKFKNERDKIKTVNFGIAYGKTEYGFAKDWNIPKAEAKKFIDDYFKRFPLIKKSISKCSFLVKQQKAIRNLTGRIRRFQWVDDRVLRQAYNFLIQGPSADMMKKAAGDFRQVCLQHPEWECKFILTLHDELLYEVFTKYTEEAKYKLKYCMENAIKLSIPLIADVGVGANYAAAKM